ncbi:MULTISPECIES: hypothetical protein [unclassified Haladaptatus]|uniref:hypothetical protein n=1 Tax=unclassified Haladaptatus TaxID=2622732 RepID=UPI00209BFC4A|nr:MULTISPECIES: hypothetical protein [unclassified Haladaptatus]MCO8245440.1 hypothetical protein [Haladaptatus sp. AB643]MCO8256551.1 hypothetical protein [Haladaptatus sp. AB618]
MDSKKSDKERRRKLLQATGSIGAASLFGILPTMGKETTDTKKDKIQNKIESSISKNGPIVKTHRERPKREIFPDNGPFIVHIEYGNGIEKVLKMELPDTSTLKAKFDGTKYTRTVSDKDKKEMEKEHLKAERNLQKSIRQDTKRTNHQYRK